MGRASSRLRAPLGRPCSGVLRRTACPPALTSALGLRPGRSGPARCSAGYPPRDARSRLLLLLGVAALETLDAAAGVNELLLARVEGVALRAELDAQGRGGGAGGELGAVRAVHLALDVVGVDVGLHDGSSLTVRFRASTGGLRSPFPPGPSRSRSGTRRWSWCCGACRSATRDPSRLPAR